jgi:DNA-binding NtrC family response regulator
VTERDVFAFADSRLSVLVSGETGTGKRTLCARLHAASPVAAGPLVFASATRLEGDRRALAASARGGALVIVRPAELSAAAQLDLAVVIDEHADVRWFATTATHANADRIAGHLTAELYFRIAGVTVELAPLRDRGNEIDAIAQAMLARHAAALGRAAPVATDDALAMLRRGPWPGNLRELDHALERWLRLAPAGVLDAASLVRALGDSTAVTGRALADELAAYERRRIREALERFRGNQTRAAKLLGMPRRTFLKRLETYGLR